MADTASSESEYQKKLGDAINSGFLAISMALGHSTGLFDVIMTAERPLTSGEIAERGKQKERYVREWLGCLSTSGIISIDDTGEAYFVPENRRHVLTRAFPLVSCLGAIVKRFEAMEDVFSLTGPAGLSMSEYGGIHQILEERSELMVNDIIDKDLLDKIPGLRQKLESGIDVAEFGCGTGFTLLELARRFPESRFHGSDVAADVIDRANQRLAEQGLKNVQFEVIDLCSLPGRLHNKFDWVYIRDVIHDVAHPDLAAAGIFQAMKEGTTCALIDINVRTRHVDNIGAPLMAFRYTMSTFFCVPESLKQDPTSIAFGSTWGVDRAKEFFFKSGFKLLNWYPCDHTDMCCLYILEK